MPENIAWVGAYLAGADGSLVASTDLVATALTPIRLELSVESSEPDDQLPIRIVGYSASDLDRVGGPPIPGGDPGERRLFEATACASALPESSFGAWRGEVEAPLIPLAVDWIQGRCPEGLRDKPLLVDPSCAEPHCGQSVRVQGCAVSVDLPRCDFPSLSGQILADGRVCLGLPADVCQMEPARDTETSFTSCERQAGSCRLRFTLARAPDWEVAEFSSYPAAVARTADSEARLAATYSETLIGYASDLAILEDEVVVLGHLGEWFVGHAVQAPPISELRYFSVSDLGLLRTATVAGAGVRMDLNPLADTLLLTTRLRDGYYLIELMRDGRELRRLLLRGIPPASTFGLLPLGSAPLPVSGRHVTLFDDNRPGEVDEVVVVDLRAWQVERRIELALVGGFGQPRVGAPFGDDRLTYADTSQNALYFLELSTGVFAPVPLLPDELKPLNNYPGGLFTSPERGLAFQSFSGPAAGVRVYRSSGVIAHAPYYQIRADVSALERIPSRPQFALAAVETGVEGDRSASLSLFDLEHFEFVPGRHEVGFGPAARIRAGRDGAMWVLFPWSGGVVRAIFPER